MNQIETVAMNQTASHAAKSRYFVALLPPEPIRESINQVKHYFATHYQSRAALKSPPHITLQPPFDWDQSTLSDLESCLEEFAAARSPLSLHLDGFAAFAPRVIYIHVVQSPALLTLQQSLLETLETTLGITDPQAKARAFTPHITVGFRDLSRPFFAIAWDEFQHWPFQVEFTAAYLTLLRHNGSEWQVYQEFPLHLGV